ncbi:MAG: hypothetical protein ABIQ72_17240 [Usitatibacter sp.]
MTQTPPKSGNPPAPKLQATRTPPAELAKGDAHEERMLDEGVDESFPASDPPASVSPGSTAAVKHAREGGRKTPKP